MRLEDMSFTDYLMDECDLRERQRKERMKQAEFEKYAKENNICYCTKELKEPCDDVVSREAVILLASIATMSIDETVEAIKRLPSVRPQEQTGHWIFYDKRKEHGICSHCGYGIVDLGDRVAHNFCPECGARMVEPTCDTCKYNTSAFMPCNACEDKSEYKPQESE